MQGPNSQLKEDTKKDAHKTNNQATVGLSILKCNLDAEVDRRLLDAEADRRHFLKLGI